MHRRMSHEQWRSWVLAALALLIAANAGRPALAGTPIDDKYAALGGSRSFLRAPVTDERVAPDGVGHYRHYQGGSIYWSPKTGAHEVHGLIRDKWAGLGWELSFLGYPITDEQRTPDGDGRYSHFENGAIYWSPATGAHEVHGLIREKWANLGWERGYLGYPITDETTASDGVHRFNTFQYGALYWSPATGAYVEGLPGGSARVRIQLTTVKCFDTEDSLGEDELYIVGASSRGTDVHAVLTSPIGINDGQTKSFRLNQAVVFDGTMPESDVIHGGLVAYDEDCGKDWSKYGDLVSSLSDLAEAGLAAGGYPTAGSVVKYATKALGLACSLDSDDELGRVDLFVAGSGPAVEDAIWKRRRPSAGLLSSSWSYEVRYRIMRAF
jgi:hypothetical protein